MAAAMLLPTLFFLPFLQNAPPTWRLHEHAAAALACELSQSGPRWTSHISPQLADVLVAILPANERVLRATYLLQSRIQSMLELDVTLEHVG